MTPELYAAVMAGLLGSGHCLGMCGPLLLATRLRTHGWKFVVAAHSGRLLSYFVAGALAAALGDQLPLHPTSPIWRGVLGLLIILAGLQVGGWWRGLHPLEGAIAPLWRRMSVRFQGMIPPRRLHHALLFGVLWGWLPCGLVYSMLLWAVTQPGMLRGGLLLVVFGVATLPSLLFVSAAEQVLKQKIPKKFMARSGGMILIIMGLWMTWRALTSLGLVLNG